MRTKAEMCDVFLGSGFVDRGVGCDGYAYVQGSLGGMRERRDTGFFLRFVFFWFWFCAYPLFFFFLQTNSGDPLRFPFTLYCSRQFTIIPTVPYNHLFFFLNRYITLDGQSAERKRRSYMYKNKTDFFYSPFFSRS